MKDQQIKTKLDHSAEGVHLGGWLQGKQTYLWVGTNQQCLAHIGGRRLYRLAKAIVRHHEEPYDS